VQPGLGGVNLEDIAQPKCFRILDTLREECEIPVWHDDQQGTACVTLAGLINALKVVGRRIDDVEIAFEVPAAGGGRPRGADPAAVVRAWREGESLVPLLSGGYAPIPADWLARFGARVADLLAARGDAGILPASALPDLARLCEELDRPPPPGLARLRGKFLVAPCSNGNISLMADLARRNGLHWDAILGAEVARDYKPKPAVYLASAAALDCAPHEAMMVAAHSSDLAAAAACGLRTAHIARPDERGPGRGEAAPGVPVDVAVASLLDLANRLGC